MKNKTNVHDTQKLGDKKKKEKKKKKKKGDKIGLVYKAMLLHVIIIIKG